MVYLLGAYWQLCVCVCRMSTYDEMTMCVCVCLERCSSISNIENDDGSLDQREILWGECECECGEKTCELSRTSLSILYCTVLYTVLCTVYCTV